MIVSKRTRAEQNYLDKIAHSDGENERKAVPLLEARKQVVRNGLRLLTELHQAVKLLEIGKQRVGTGNVAEGLDYTAMPTVNGIMDVLFIEGVYPDLSPGVGYPQICRSRSLLYRELPQDYETSHNLNMRDDVVDEVGCIFDDRGEGIEPFIAAQYMPDFVAAAAQVAYGNGNNDRYTGLERERFRRRIDK